MSITKFWNKKIKKLDWLDMGLIKIAGAAFILIIAKLWKPLLSLSWYWYGIIYLLLIIRPVHKAYFKK